MAFEAAFGVTLTISILLGLACFKLLRKNANLVNENALLTAKLETREKDIPDMVKAMSGTILREHGETFKTTTTEPLDKRMGELNAKIEELNREGIGNREVFNTNMDKLLHQVNTISDVLRNPRKRGRHAEMEIERIFEIAGLTRGIHYTTQHTKDGKRPDFVVNLTGERSVIIDSKAPLDMLWVALDADDEATKVEAMEKHVRAVRNHIKQLAAKEYLDGEYLSLDYTVMVVPEYALLPALERSDDIMEYALQNRVVLVTPSTLVVLLRAVDLMWKQNDMAKHVREVGKLSADVYAKLGKFADHYNRLGKGLEDAVKHFNGGLGSWNRRLLPAAARLGEMGAVTKDLPDVDRVKSRPDGRLTTES